MPGTETFANGFFVSRCAIAGTDIRVFLGNVADAVSGWEAEDVVLWCPFLRYRAWPYLASSCRSCFEMLRRRVCVRYVIAYTCVSSRCVSYVSFLEHCLESGMSLTCLAQITSPHNQTNSSANTNRSKGESESGQVSSPISLRHTYSLSGTDIAYVQSPTACPHVAEAICLRPPYGLSGTDFVYGQAETPQQPRLPAPGLNSAMGRRVPDTMSGTDLVFGATSHTKHNAFSRG
eukprot:1064085-Rhodomonas_salina.3